MPNILLCYLIFLPAAVLCFLPVKGKLKYSPGRIFAVLVTVFSVMIALATYLTWRFELRQNDLLAPMLLLSYLSYHLSLNISPLKSLSVFLLVASLLSSITNYAACFDAASNPSSGLGTYTLSFTMFQLIATVLVILIIAHPFAKYGSLLIDQPISPKVWYGMILFSVSVIITNLSLLPNVYYLFREQFLTANILILISSQFVVWILLMLIMHYGVSSILTADKIREKNRILEMQEKQFRSLQNYVRASEKTRHDFRHSIQTLAELYHAGETEALGRYLDQYIDSMPKNEIQSFCDILSLNALLNFYVHVTKLNHIAFTLRVNVSDELPLSDVNLCSIVGNILENAVAASKNTDEKKIQFTILAEDHAQLYIVAVNSFDGIVRMKNGQYLSTKQKSSGIGLSSVTSIVESCGGIALFSHEGNKFFSSIAIPLQQMS